MSNETSLLQKTLKPKAIEEWVDFYFHRRLAVPFVRAAYFLKLSPNQVTLLSLFSGCLAAFLFYKNQFFSASLFLLLAVVLDCADGMLARLLGVSSPLGRILDGCCDAVWVALTWVGLYFSHHYSYPPSTPLLVFMSLSGASMFAHCNTFDAFKIGYLSLTTSAFKEGNLSLPQALQSLKNSFFQRKIIEGFGYLAHVLYESSPGRNQIIYKPARVLNLEENKKLEKILRNSSFLGEGTHLFLIVLGGLLTPWYQNAMLVVCALILVPLNGLWLRSIQQWLRMKKRLLQPS